MKHKPPFQHPPAKPPKPAKPKKPPRSTGDSGRAEDRSVDQLVKGTTTLVRQGIKTVAENVQIYVQKLLLNPANFEQQPGSFFRVEGNVLMRERAFKSTNFPCKVSVFDRSIVDLG